MKTHAHEEDVVAAFRQAVEEELRQAAEGVPVQEELFSGDASTTELLQRLAARQEDLQREVALLRTIILRLVSEPVDADND